MARFTEEKRDGCVECMRYGFVMINGIFLIFGIGLLFLGVWFYAVPANENVATITLNSTEQNEINIAILLVIGVGTGVSFLAIVSCCGAFAQNKCLLMLIFIFMMILLVLELVIGAFGAIFHQQIKTGITDQMAKTLAYNYSGDDGENPESMAWREMQKAFECCGVNSTKGYLNHTQLAYENVTGSLWYRTSDQSSEWPGSCCKVYKNGTSHGDISCYGGSEIDNNYLNERGCADSVQTFLQTHMLTIAIMAIIILVIQVSAMICSFKLYKSSPKKQKKKSGKVVKESHQHEELHLEDYSY